MELSNKTILITGGNSGIGLCLSKQLYEMGNRLIVVSRSRNNWQQLAEHSNVISTLQCDLSKEAQVCSLAEQIKSLETPLDLLIHSAAVQYTPMLHDSTFDFQGINREVTTNFTAIVWLIYLLLDDLLSRPAANIVNLSSGLALYPKRQSAVYCATKAALHSFSQSLRYQLEGTTVAVTEVLLPLVDTPMTADRGKGKITPEVAAQAIIEGLEREKEEIYIGKARLLPIMSRLWPGLVKRLLRGH